MKKKIISCILAICLILPFSIMFTGCKEKNSNGNLAQTQIEESSTTETKLKSSDAFNAYKLALLQYEMNYKDSRSNMKVIKNNEVLREYYNAPNGDEIIITKDSTGKTFYWKNSYMQVYSYDITNNTKQIGSFTYFIEGHNSYIFRLSHNLFEEDLVTYEIDKDGNYYLKFAKHSYENPTHNYVIYEYVITEDLKFLSSFYQNVNYSKTGSHSPFLAQESYKFEHGTVNAEEILATLETAKELQIQQ